MRFRLLPDSDLGWTPYAWLVYLSWFLLYAIFASRTPVEWAINAAALAVFLGLYFRGFWLEGQALITVSFALVGLGVVMTPINPGASSFFIYGAAFLGEAARPVVAYRWLVLIMAIIAAEAWLVPLRPEAWLTGLILSGVIGGTNIHFAEVRRQVLDARRAAEHLAVVAERERIARDLHDLLGHTLSVIVLKSELASKIAERDPGRALAEIRDVERISREALQEVRRAVRGYRAERVGDEVARGRAALAATGVTLYADISPLDGAEDAEPALALAVREALTNVLRHARARRCDVVLEQLDDSLRVVIQDDGVGGPYAEGSGLSGMRARLAGVGGSLLVSGAAGTRVEMTVPRRRPVMADREVAAS